MVPYIQIKVPRVVNKWEDLEGDREEFDTARPDWDEYWYDMYQQYEVTFDFTTNELCAEDVIREMITRTGRITNSYPFFMNVDMFIAARLAKLSKELKAGVGMLVR